MDNFQQNSRSLFYLANNYYDSGMFEIANDLYMIRIKDNGCSHEIFYSYYRIGNYYYRIGNVIKAICNWLEGYNSCNDRLESMYKIINHYTSKGENKLAIKYMSIIEPILEHSKDVNKTYIFLENDVYDYKLYFEKIINSYYVGITNVNLEIVKIFNNCEDNLIINNTLSNMKFYKFILNQVHVYDYSDSLIFIMNDKTHNFYSSSPSILKKEDGAGYLVNIRYVNYELIDYISYKIQHDSILTINKLIHFDNDFKLISTEMINNINYKEGLYGGVEDIRIFNYKTKDLDKLVFIGSRFDNTIGVAWGNYKIINNSIEPKQLSQDFIVSDCEKNWVFFNYKNETCIIYSWYPIRICKINENTNELILLETKNMTKYFNRVRGSSCGFTYECNIWFVQHIVSYEKPRHYYDIITVFDENMNLLKYTPPFKFSECCIQYCLGLIVEKERIILSYSEGDKSSKFGIYHKQYIDSIMIIV